MEKEIKKVLENQMWEGRQELFDPDSSPLAWEYYKKNYTNITYTDEYKKYGNDKKGYRLKCKAKLKDKKKNIEFEVAGDCSFNFNDEKKGLFESIIEKEEDLAKKENLQKKLNYCHDMHRTLYNFDLIPVTGGMNNVKGNLKYKNGKILVHDLGRRPGSLHDRLDTFIYLVDYFLSRRNEYERKKNYDLKEIGVFYINSVFSFSLRGENFEFLYELLENYNDIYEYCKDFYNINNKEFVKRLIENGKSEIENPEDLCKYMKLAEDFWELKKKIYKL